MANVRFTLLCNKLKQFKAKGITPNEMKTMKKSDIDNQIAINNSYNARGIELGDILISKLNDVDITWCNDGCLVVSCSNTINQVETVIADEGLEIQADRSDIKHKVKPLDPNDSVGVSEEDIDEVFEQDFTKAKNKLKKNTRINKYQRDKIA